MTFDLITHLLAWCQACVPDAQSVAPAVGIIGGTAGAIGAIGGLPGGVASSVSGSGASDAPSDNDASSVSASDADSGDGANGDDAGDADGLAEPPSSFNDTTGGFQMHEAPDPPTFPDDPFHSPSANPQPIYSDGSQVDGSNKPGDDTTETDYINPDGTPMGSTPAAPHHAPAAPASPPHKAK